MKISLDVDYFLTSSFLLSCKGVVLKKRNLSEMGLQTKVCPEKVF